MGLKHLDEEGDGYGHSQFTGHIKRYPAAEAEPSLCAATISRDAGARQPGRPALLTVDHLGNRCGDPQTAFCGTGREQFLVCGLDVKHSIIGVNIVSIGSLTLAIVHPREVFKPLILMNAGAWICAHNHPSGDTTPSQEDLVLTSRLKQGADLLGIRLLDHLILTDERCYSFADQGWPSA